MKLFTFVVLYCFYAILINYFLKKRFKIGFWDEWSKSDLKIDEVELVMLIVLACSALVGAGITYYCGIILFQIGK